MNIYLTQMIFGLVEMPARTITLFTLNRSRKISQLAFLAVGGTACLLTIFIPSGMDTHTKVLCWGFYSWKAFPSLFCHLFQTCLSLKLCWPWLGSLGSQPLFPLFTCTQLRYSLLLSGECFPPKHPSVILSGSQSLPTQQSSLSAFVKSKHAVAGDLPEWHGMDLWPCVVIKSAVIISP